MPDEFAHTQFPFFLYPEMMTYMRAQGIMEYNEEHTAIEITEGRVGFLGVDRRYMQIAFQNLNMRSML
jgi:hypothetical protein